MRKLIVFLALLVVPTQLAAFSTNDALALVAMPLAVAAVSDVAGVPQDQLADIVATLNQANVPPVQFVEVVRYVPVTFVGQPVAQPTFTEFVRTETSRGVTGPALVTSITRRLETTYDVQPQLVINEPATTFVVRRDYIPRSVVSFDDPLALIALPLAVAAASEITGVPSNQLADLVATLNNANVPVTQEIQVIRYAPVMLTTDTGPQFVEFVQTQVSNGVTGPALVPVVVQRIQTVVPEQQVVFAPTTERIVIDDDFIRPHPHGGPPGQIKKQLGLQTGAEVVHGVKPGRQFNPPMASTSRPVVVVPKEHGRGHGGGGGKGGGHGKGHKQQVQVIAPPASAPVVMQPAPAAAPMVMPGNPGRGHGGGGGEKGNKGEGGGKGHGKKGH